jgi:hypothetical protein
MNENEMGNRGSKSVFESNTVKEQRVDGNWLLNKLIILKVFRSLRCILMGFERNSHIKILSKQLNKNKRNYSTLIQNTKINPWFVTGFSDAEASFSVLIYINKKLKGKLGRIKNRAFKYLYILGT